MKAGKAATSGKAATAGKIASQDRTVNEEWAGSLDRTTIKSQVTRKNTAAIGRTADGDQATVSHKVITKDSAIVSDRVTDREGVTTRNKLPISDAAIIPARPDQATRVRPASRSRIDGRRPEPIRDRSSTDPAYLLTIFEIDAAPN